MENIINNPGLQHLAEKVFWDLDDENLKNCAQINQYCKQILQNPIFYLKKFEHLSNTNRKNWIDFIQSVKHSDKEIAIISYLQWNLKKDALVDLPCYSSSAIQERIRDICNTWGSTKEDLEIVKILAPLTDNPNAEDENGRTMIYIAAFWKHTDIVKILASLTDNPNAPNKDGETPIHAAADKGLTEIVNILAPLTANPNAADRNGDTPIHFAARKRNLDIVEILAPLTDNPNPPNRKGETPAYCIANLEIGIWKFPNLFYSYCFKFWAWSIWVTKKP